MLDIHISKENSDDTTYKKGRRDGIKINEV